MLQMEYCLHGFIQNKQFSVNFQMPKLLVCCVTGCQGQGSNLVTTIRFLSIWLPSGQADKAALKWSHQCQRSNCISIWSGLVEPEVCGGWKKVSDQLFLQIVSRVPTTQSGELNIVFLIWDVTDTRKYRTRMQKRTSQSNWLNQGRKKS